METIIRLSAAFGIFLLMICCEYWRPRRVLQFRRIERWPVNIGLATLNMLVMRVSIGNLAYQAAVYAQANGWGLINITGMTAWIAVTLTLLALDFAIYAQHILMHRWPLFWRLHQVHHADLDFDATTAVRFHPIEIIVSMLYKTVCLLLLGADPQAVIAFEIILNGAATFNHSNVYIPPTLDHKLRSVLVTPDMHRIHHSTLRAEMDSNYGFSISVWDRLCGTYHTEPQEAHQRMAIGLPNYRENTKLSFLRLLQLPFKPLSRG